MSAEQTTESAVEFTGPELGNLAWGHSRGEAHIPRETPWERPLFDLLEAAGCDSYGWPKFENATFLVQSYDWGAECDCGFEARVDKWHAEHPHSPDCYQTELKERERAAGCAYWDGEEWINLNKLSYDQESAIKDRIYKDLMAKHNLPRQGCAVHCTCYKERAAEAKFAKDDHTPTCRVVQPNFLHKPSGFRVMWYKYPLRDSYMTPPVSVERWAEIMSECRASLRTPSKPKAETAPSQDGTNSASDSPAKIPSGISRDT